MQKPPYPKYNLDPEFSPAASNVDMRVRQRVVRTLAGFVSALREVPEGFVGEFLRINQAYKDLEAAADRAYDEQANRAADKMMDDDSPQWATPDELLGTDGIDTRAAVESLLALRMRGLSRRGR